MGGSRTRSRSDGATSCVWGQGHEAVVAVREELSTRGQGLQDPAGVLFPARRSDRIVRRPV